MSLLLVVLDGTYASAGDQPRFLSVRAWDMPARSQDRALSLEPHILGSTGSGRPIYLFSSGGWDSYARFLQFLRPRRHSHGGILIRVCPQSEPLLLRLDKQRQQNDQLCHGFVAGRLPQLGPSHDAHNRLRNALRIAPEHRAWPRKSENVRACSVATGTG